MGLDKNGWLRTRTARYGLAVISTLAAFGLRLALTPVLHLKGPFLLFFVSTSVSAVLAGRGPGLIATALGAVLGGLFVVPPIGSLYFDSADDYLVAGLFLSVSSLISVLAGSRLAAIERERDALELLQQTLLSIGDAVVATDASQRVFFMNPVAEELTGWKQAEAQGRDIAEVFRIFKEGTTEPAEIPTGRILETGLVHGLANHTELHSKTGRVIPIDDSGAPIRDSAGKVKGAVLVFRDISERRGAELELERLNARLRSVTQSISDRFYLLDRDFRFLQVNEAAERVMAKSAQELVGRQVMEIYPEVKGSDFEQLLVEVRSTGKPVHRETFYAPEGLWFDNSLYPHPEGILVLSRDVTETRKMQEDLARLNARLSNLLNSLTDGFLLLDREFRYILWNRAALELFRRNERDLLGRHYLDMFPELRGTEIEHAIERAAKQAEPVLLDFFYPPQQRWYEAGFFSHPEGVAVYFRDITERKDSDAKLRRLNADLENFVFAVTHDMREPLRTITMYVQLIERRYENSLDEQGRAFIATATTGVSRLTRLIDGLLRFSRLSRLHEVGPSPTDADAALREALDSVERKVEESRATVRRPARLPVVLADPAQLSQVFQNLIENALKYVADGRQPDLEISAADEGDQAVFAVRDNGMGISPEYHKRIFEPFQRLHGSEIAGSGIGLATCRRIIERYGGRIWVESDAGRGATFFFTLRKAQERTGTAAAS
jgi:PAS domain S-box-containing protein